MENEQRRLPVIGYGKKRVECMLQWLGGQDERMPKEKGGVSIRNIEGVRRRRAALTKKLTLLFVLASVTKSESEATRGLP